MSKQFKKLETETQWMLIFFCAIFNVLLWTHVVNEVMAAPINATQGTVDNVIIGGATPKAAAFTGATFDYIGVTHMSLTGMLSAQAIRIGSLTTQTGTQSAAGDLLGFIGTGQPSFVKSAVTGKVLMSKGVGTMPSWDDAAGVDWTIPGTIGSVTPNTIKGTTIQSTTGLTVAAGGIVSKETVAAGGSGIIGQADSGVAIANNDRLGYYLLGGAKDAISTMNNSAGLSAYSTQAWTGSAAGTKLQLEVTPNGSTTRSTAVTIDQDSTATFVVSKHTSLNSTALNKAGVPVPSKTDLGIPMWMGTLGGSATAYTASVADVTAYTAGMSFVGFAQTSNTGTAPTLNINSLGAKTIKRNGTEIGSVVNAADIGTGAAVQFLYDGTDMRLMDPSQIKTFAGQSSYLASTYCPSSGVATVVTITGVGFSPSAIIASGTNASSALGQGYWAKPIGNYGAFQSSATSTSWSSPGIGNLFNLIEGASTNMCNAAISAVNGDGFQITFTRTAGTPSGTIVVTYLAYK